MNVRTDHNNGFSVKAHQGDAKTLLAFNLADPALAKGLAGFTIQCKPEGLPAYYLLNNLQFENPGSHAQDAAEPPTSSINAPFHKFRWLHVPGSFHQGVKPFHGPYTYTATPRYFDVNQSLKPLDPTLSAAVTIDVGPFVREDFRLGFTRGFTQSQAFVHHFGLKALIQPKAAALLFDTSQMSGVNAQGVNYTFQEEYEWLGFTARICIFDVLNEVLNDPALRLDMFAYDLNEPDLLKILLALSAQGRIRLILDNAALHHDKDNSKREDKFEIAFTQAAKSPAAILRGKFGRYAHDKVFIVSDGTGPQTVLTGSTNFSVTGLYVNSNHVLVLRNRAAAAKYSEVFEAVWISKAATKAFSGSPLAAEPFSFAESGIPKFEVTFSPHDEPTATKILGAMASRIDQEGKTPGGCLLFAVMELGKGSGPVISALQEVHENQSIYSYGVTDTTDGIRLYSRGQKTGVLVTGKPASAKLPAPFDQVPGVGIGHQIHHKFVVCGFNGADPTVYCGSSNLALMGEQVNGDNLLAIHDTDVATVFAIEALGLVDHFAFLDRIAQQNPAAADPNNPLKTEAAVNAGWFLDTTDAWSESYFDPNDLHFADRLLFA